MDNRRQSGLWDQNAQGVYERKTPAGPFQYYQPPPPSDRRRSFSERAAEGLSKGANTDVNALQAATQNGLERSTSIRKSNTRTQYPELDNIDTSLARHLDSSNARIVPAKHINELSEHAPYDDDDESDSIPENLRRQAWSPELKSPVSPTSRNDTVPLRHASNASAHIRRGSVPDRSPLQNLEVKLDNISKEEKRARVEEAERRARQDSVGESGLARSTTIQSGKGKVVPDGGRRANDGVKRDDRRHVSAGAAEESPVSPRDTGSERFRRASNALRTSLEHDRGVTRDTALVSPTAGQAQPTVTDTPATSIGRTQSQKYRHRARDAGFAGAAAAIAGASVESAAARGKAAHERRKSQIVPVGQPRTPTVRDDAAAAERNDTDDSWGPAHAAVLPTPRRQSEERPRSKRLQKPPPTSSQWKSSHGVDPHDGSDTRQGSDSDQRLLHGNRMGADGGKLSSGLAPLKPDIIAKEDVRTGPETGVPYRIPPQTAAARQAKERVSFAPDVTDPTAEPSSQTGHGHHLRNLLGGYREPPRGYVSNAKPLEEWRTAEVAKLSAAQVALEDDSAPRSDAWWEKQGNARARPVTLDGPYEEQASKFSPELFLKCGPLLRFTGLRRSSKTGQGAHSWRGSVMIVTEDEYSDLRKAPTLRLFAQPSDLFTPKSHEHHENHEHHDSDDEDPITGQVKTSRTGRPIYVRPIEDLQHGVDLSRQENNTGLFTASRPLVLGPQSSTGADGKNTSHITSQNTSRVKQRDGEKLKKYQDIRAHRLHVEHGCTFWRFNLEVELVSKPARIAYRINNGPAVGFWVPARGESMNVMFHSCNGFSLAVDAAEFCGPDPLWRDVLNRHQSKPFHVMIGGGDQIYNDAAMRDTTYFKEWLQMKNPEHKHHADFTVEMQEELESFYFNRYAMWFSQGLFGMANAQIPMVNIYDDHDIIDGFGSYPHRFMSSPVFTGLGAIAFKYYMLFQHQSLPTETTADEPSWLLGASPGPYINELNRSVFVWLGEKVALLAIDCRTERMRDEILSQESYDIIFERCRRELVAGDTKHLLVLLGVPIAYPRLNFLENILTSRLMDPIKALGRTGALGGFVNKFDGGVEILDDLDDHWTAKHHKEERNWFIQELQELAAEKSVRVTILGGDVHLGAVGQFYSNKKLGIPKDKDHRYMPNIVSSAIVNTPPPAMMADVLNKRNKIHHLDKETDEDMIPMFSHDVDGSRRNNRHLLPRRNYAIIREYMPGTTPPPSEQPSMASLQDDSQLDNNENQRPASGSIRRNMSLNRKPGNLIRRLSLRGKNPPVAFNPSENKPSRRFSYDGAAATESDSLQQRDSIAAPSSAQRPSFSFQRRPTNLSLKEARKAAAMGGADGDDDDNLPGHINLEHGLDISLCMEVDQHNAAGHTEPYRLLVPALWYHGPGDKNHLTLPARRPSLFKRMTGGRQKAKESEVEHDQEKAEFYDDDSLVESPVLGRATHARPAVSSQNRNTELEELQATAAGAGSSGLQKHNEPRSPYLQRGYDLGAPPVGPSTAAKQSAFTQAPAAYTDDDDDDDSFTESELNSGDDESLQMEQQRQSSKAERFLGMSEAQQEAEGMSRQTSVKRRSIWTPWKSSNGKVWPG
ncbi:hypothetical protein AMS68_001897 [Peltaster fructicola]|uniref:PhoD-like phosphatase domain-containing protein n=1 Tax=Peltaster fructicola TaxID=286661 RepID=A0A6H0XPH2_9PEZI|nr:hypothetical protein AMS68_001897 [Peltaster fructicola]